MTRSPVLHFDSKEERNNAVLDMWAKGMLSSEQIGRMVGLSGGMVRVIARRNRGKDHRARPRESGRVPHGALDSLEVYIPKNVRTAFATEAQIRATTTDALISRVLTLIVEDNLFDAVIDDG